MKRYSGERCFRAKERAAKSPQFRQHLGPGGGPRPGFPPSLSGGIGGCLIVDTPWNGVGSVALFLLMRHSSVAGTIYAFSEHPWFRIRHSRAFYP